jgi:drug/metabolite transporter (DMT)-like permease
VIYLKIKQKYKAILCICCSAFSFSVMNICIRLAGDLPTFEKAFFRNFVAMIFAGVLLLKEGKGFRPQPGCLPGLFARAACGTVGLLCNFYAVDHLVVADASMLNKMSPFFAIVFSYFLLKEKLTLPQGAAVVVAFLGSLLIIKPTFSNLELLPSVVGFIGGMGAGMAYTWVRILGQKGERGTYIVFFFSAFSVLVTIPLMLMNWVPMSPVQLLCLLCCGLAAAAGQFAITKAYSLAPAKEVSVYDYTQIIFSALLGWLVFQQVPDVYSVVGYFVICSVAVLMFFYNNRKSLAVGEH